MDHGVEMNELETRSAADAKRREEIKLFLGRATEKLRAGGGAGYDLISEYRKTRKNRSLIVPLSIIVVLLVFVGLSWLVTRSIDASARKVSIDIEAFEDLNLKDLLDLAKNSAESLDRASYELATLEAALAAEFSRLREQRDAALAVAKAMGTVEFEKRRVSIEAAQKEGERVARAKYEPLIKEKRLEVAALQEQIASYDSRSIEEAKKQQEILDNQQQLFELEKQRLIALYEQRVAAVEKSLQAEKITGAARLDAAIADLTKQHKQEMADLTAKYNPVWTDERSVSLASSVDASASPNAPSDPRSLRTSDLPAGSPIGLEDFRASMAKYEQLRFLLGKLRTVPYINSIPGTLAATEFTAADFAASYSGLLDKSATASRALSARIAGLEADLVAARTRYEAEAARLVASRASVQASLDSVKGSLDKANASVDSYSWAFSSFARGENEAGFIVDSRNPARLLLFIDPVYKVQNGTSAWVFRSVDAPVAEIRLRREGDAIIGSVERAEAGQVIQSFDRILLKLTDKPVAEKTEKSQ
jgi:hypothetical protein